MSVTQELTDADYKGIKDFVVKKMGCIPYENVGDVISRAVAVAYEKGFNPEKGSLQKYLRGRGKGGRFWVVENACDKWKKANGYCKFEKKKDTKKQGWEKVELTFSETIRENADGELEYPDYTDSNQLNPLERLLDIEEYGPEKRDRAHAKREIELADMALIQKRMRKYMSVLERKNEFEKLYTFRAFLGIGKLQDIRKLKQQKSRNSTYWKNIVLSELVVLLKLNKMQVISALDCIKKSWAEKTVKDRDNPKITHKVRKNEFEEIFEGLTIQGRLFF